MAKPQKSTAQSEVPGLVKKGPLYYLKRDWQLYALMLLPMVFIIVFKYFAYTGLSVAFLDYKIGKGYAGSKFVGLKIFEKVFKHRDFTKAVVNTLLLNVLDLIFSLSAGCLHHQPRPQRPDHRELYERRTLGYCQTAAAGRGYLPLPVWPQ